MSLPSTWTSELRLVQCSAGAVQVCADLHLAVVLVARYCNLDPKHPESYHAFMWRHLFQHIDIK